MVSIKTAEEIQRMRAAGKILAHTFDEIAKYMRPGVCAKFIDDLAREIIHSYGATPSFLGYRGYEYSTCISKNEEVVHGIPHAHKELLPGDIWSVDIGVCFNGYHADAARIFDAPPITPEIQSLIDVTMEAFFKGIAFAKSGCKLGDLSNAIQTYAERYGFSVVRDLYSHGIGKELHEDPMIPNFGRKNTGISLQEGMTFAIEPMINMGTPNVLTQSDKWTIVTADKKWSAHFENTILVTNEGPEILTIMK